MFLEESIGCGVSRADLKTSRIGTRSDPGGMGVAWGLKKRVDCRNQTVQYQVGNIRLHEEEKAGAGPGAAEGQGLRSFTMGMGMTWVWIWGPQSYFMATLELSVLVLTVLTVLVVIGEERCGS